MKLKVHTRVRHKEYGEGKINKITPEKVYVTKELVKDIFSTFAF